LASQLVQSLVTAVTIVSPENHLNLQNVQEDALYVFFKKNKSFLE